MYVYVCVCVCVCCCKSIYPLLLRKIISIFGTYSSFLFFSSRPSLFCVYIRRTVTADEDCTITSTGRCSCHELGFTERAYTIGRVSDHVYSCMSNNLYNITKTKRDFYKSTSLWSRYPKDRKANYVSFITYMCIV